MGVVLRHENSTREAPEYQAMRIDFQRTGGFAGLTLRKTFDSASLPTDRQRELEQLLETSGFFDLPHELHSAEPSADRFQYRLTVERGGRSHTVRAAEATAPDALRPLLDWLTAASREKG